jgi:FHA domain-containing protein
MSLLVRLERRIEALVEGFFSRWIHDRVHPLEIGRRLFREMDRGAVAGLQGEVVPNDYQVFLNPADFAPYASAEVLPELAEALRLRAQTLRARLPGPVRVRIVPREEIGPGRIYVEARLVTDAADAGETGGPRGEPGEAAAAGSDTRVYRRAPGTAAAPRLRIQAGPQGAAGREFALDRPVMVIGRRADQDIVLHDPSISRAHARIETSRGDVAILDLGSTNGTRVNGRPVGRARVLLRAGDRVQIGSILLEYLAPP